MSAEDRPSTPEDVDPPTRELVKRTRAAKEAGFASLYARIAPALYAWARLRVHSELRQHLDPEDLVQEVCIRAYERFDSYDDARSIFRAWLFGIANNVLRESLNQMRKQSRHRATGAERDSAWLERVPTEATSVSRRVAKNEGLRDFVSQLEKLDDDDKRHLIYRGLEGLRHAEVASLLGLTVDAAEKRWQRLLKRLDENRLTTDLFEG